MARPWARRGRRGHRASSPPATLRAHRLPAACRIPARMAVTSASQSRSSKAAATTPWTADEVESPASARSRRCRTNPAPARTAPCRASSGRSARRSHRGRARCAGRGSRYVGAPRVRGQQPAPIEVGPSGRVAAVEEAVGVRVLAARDRALEGRKAVFGDIGRNAPVGASRAGPSQSAGRRSGWTAS